MRVAPRPVLPYRVRPNDDRARPRRVAASPQPGPRLDAPSAARPVVDARRPRNWSWASSTSRRIRSPTAVASRTSKRRSFTGCAWSTRARRSSTSAASRPDRQPSRLPPTRRGRASLPVVAALSGRHHGADFNRHLQGKRRCGGDRSRRVDRQRRLGVSARSLTWRASSRRPARPR